MGMTALLSYAAKVLFSFAAYIKGPERTLPQIKTLLIAFNVLVASTGAEISMTSFHLFEAG
jgi:hypothetical protein